MIGLKLDLQNTKQIRYIFNEYNSIASPYKERRHELRNWYLVKRLFWKIGHGVTHVANLFISKFYIFMYNLKFSLLY